MVDVSELLDNAGHQRYQMLLGMLNWIVCIGRMDVAFLTASLSHVRHAQGKDIWTVCCVNLDT